MVSGEALYDVVGVEERFLDEAPDVVVVGQVEDPSALAAGAHQAAEAKLGEMLGHGRRSCAEVVGELVDRMLPVEERPHDSEPSRVGEHREHLDRPVDLSVHRVLNFLRIHADKGTSPATSGTAFTLNAS